MDSHGVSLQLSGNWIVLHIPIFPDLCGTLLERLPPGAEISAPGAASVETTGSLTRACVNIAIAPR